MISSSDYSTLIASSASAGVFSGVFTNVLEVMKTNIMNEAISGKENSAITGHWKKRFTFTCTCYICFIRDLFKKEGYRYVFRGVGYNTSMSMLRSSILFPLYEFSSPRFNDSKSTNSIFDFQPQINTRIRILKSLNIGFPI